jgi:hypothetical protein
MKIKTLTTILALAAVVTFGVAKTVQGQAQQGLLDDVAARLTQDGVPVKSYQLGKDVTFTPPLVAQFTLQGSSENNKFTPDDPIFTNMVGHEVNLAKRRGLDIGAFRVTFVNTGGEVLVVETRAPMEDAEWPGGFDKPSTLSAGEVSTLLGDLPSFGMSRQGVKVSLNREGLKTVAFDLEVPTIDEANLNLSNMVVGTRSRLNDMNRQQGSQIAVYTVRVRDASGRLLLNYINDLQVGGRQDWWQADDLTGGPFPRPAPP